MSQSNGSTLFCKLEFYALSKKTVLKISLSPGLKLTIFLGSGLFSVKGYEALVSFAAITRLSAFYALLLVSVH